MKGDFSWLDHRPTENFTGVLEQQGRVRLDRDGLAAEEIARHLRNLMGRDTFGPGRVAVPAEASDSLRVTAAETDGATVTVTFQPGRAWIDGVPLHIAAAETAQASYLPPPFQPATAPDSIAPGVRDAVVLEVWEDSLSAFQDPTSLLETALGGVDTTERVKVFHRLRLRRLGDDEDCTTIGPSLQDDPDDIGRLTVTPTPAIAIAGDCPVEAGGGYTGDGHRLFCVEVASPGGNGPRFTWSRFGGGLVGRGRFDAIAAEITVTHNHPMIAAADVAGFHLQALAPDPATGDWTVQFTATVSFTDGVLSVSTPTGTWPAAAGETAFFRLWDGIADISAFAAAATELADGILLQFAPIVNGGENYRAGDRWLFPARTAGSGFDPSIWPQHALPMAIRYHRAPLAVLNWTSAPPDSLTAPGEIEDCRDGFQPLTNPCPCCTVVVGDGRTTHGDTDSIEAALERLPAAGGRICLLPGLHECNAVIRERADIRITGCGKHSRVVPRPGAREEPIFHVIDSESITLDSMDMLSLSGVAVLAESQDDDTLRLFTVRDSRILACIRAIQVEGGSETVIRSNRIRMLDRRDAGVAVYLTGEDSRIEDNDIGVVPAEATPRPPDRPDDASNPDDPADPCADPDLIYANFGFFIGFVEFVFGFTLTAIVPPPYRALGGIQIGAGAERVAVIDNRILGGAGNGITLGGSHLAGDDGGGDGPRSQDVTLGRSVLAIRATVVDPDGNPAAGVTIRVTAPSGTPITDVTDEAGLLELAGSGEQGPHRFESVDPAFGIQSATITDTINLGAGSIVIMRIELNRQRQQPDPALGLLYGIRIEDNEITAMGLNGIGAPPSPAVLAPQGQDGAVTRPVAIAPRYTAARAAAVNPLLARLGHPVVDLTIRNNRITGNLQTPFNAAMRDEARRRGFGGISLGVCETVTIGGNRIEANGRRFVDPVCGIFILFGEQVEVTDNLIRDNGPFVAVDADVERGQRGGIVGIFLAFGLDDLGQDQFRLSAKPALRVHDNVVQQPMGRALSALAAGPVSIVANHLATERTAGEALDLMAGTMLVYNLAGVARLPAGGCLVNSNQITLGQNSNAFIAVALAAAQDIGFDANQVDAMQAGLVSPNFVAMLNTLIFAATARATGNRFRERSLNAEIALQVSLLSMTTQMNIATSNQGDHCIFAFDQSTPPRLVNAQNLVLDTQFCEQVAGAAAGAARNPVLGAVGLSSMDFVINAGQPTGNAINYASGLDSTLSALSSFQRGQLAEAAEIKASTRALWVNEAARMATRSSTRADLSAVVAQRLDSSIRDSARFRAAADAVSTRPQTAAGDGGLLLQGRVVDANARGAAEREVQLADSGGRALTGVQPVRTDATGGYVFRLTEDQVKANAEAIRAGLAVVVAPAQRGDEPVRSDRFAVGERSAIVPDVRLGNAFARASEATAATRPTEPVAQPLTRPVLSPAERLTVTSGRISPLIRNSRPTPGRDDR